MGEIDDFYNERLEGLENEFFENFKKGKDRKEVVEDYHKKLDKTVKTFEKDYTKSLEKEKEIASKVKALKQEKTKFDFLKVTHFDFNQTTTEKLKMKWTLFWFKMGRSYRTHILNKIPTSMIYYNYKIKIILRTFFEVIKEIFESILYSIKMLILGVYHLIFRGIVKILQTSIHVVKSLVSKINFFKKKEEKKEEVKNEEKKEEPKGEN